VPVADFLMPSLGADMEHGKIVEWLVKPGDYVRRGDLVAVVDTDKTVMDVESFQEGVVAELLVDPGATVPIGTPLARITPTPAETGAPAGPPAAAGAPVPASDGGVPPVRTAADFPGEAPPIAPPVRHLAHRLGVDTARIRGTG
jgi:pyruvate dehydrogenase E2 component (dihydrolipoamide acetyltransferase)